MKKLVSLVAFFLLLILTALGQDTNPNLILYEFDDILKPIKEEIGTWAYNYKSTLALTFLIGILGIITSAAIGIGKKWSRLTGILLGVIISVVTLVQNTFYDTSYKEYRKAVVEADLLLDQIEMYQKELKYMETLNDSIEQAKLISRELNRFYDIKSRIMKESAPATNPGIASATGGFLINGAYAGTPAGDLPLWQEEQREVPSWVRQVPESKTYIYVLGVAGEHSLNTAKNLAYENALDRACELLAGELHGGGPDLLEPDQLGEIISSSATVDRTFFNYNEEIFDYYILLRFNREVIESNIKLYSAVYQREVPKDIDNRINKIYNPDFEQINKEYLEDRSRVREASTNFARENLSLSEEVYGKYKRARNLRIVDKNYDESLELLLQVIEEAPEYYLGWFEIAMVYEGHEMMEQAEEAYVRAIDLDREYNDPNLDASLYNTYGFFLYNQRRFEEALPNYEVAVTVNPNHTTAQRYLERTRERLGQ